MHGKCIFAMCNCLLFSNVPLPVCVCEVSVYLPEFLDREQRATLLHWGRVEDEAASGCPGCAQPVYACRVVVRDDFKRINP